MTYGESPAAHLRARDDPTRSVRDPLRRLGLGARAARRAVRLPLPGRHNVANALAAIAVGRELLIPFETIAPALADFTGVIRRFEKKGERAGVLVVDDYAHHPTELSATLAAARQVHPDRRLVALFQPHLFSRTRDFATEFGRALLGADVAVVTDIYPSREKPLPGVTGQLVVRSAREAGHRNLIYMSDKKRVADRLERLRARRPAPDDGRRRRRAVRRGVPRR